MPSPSLPFVINTHSDWMHWIGDSLVEWFGNVPAGGGIAGPLYWQIHSQQAINQASYSSSSSRDPNQSYLIPLTQDGKSGTQYDDISQNLTTRVINPLINNGLNRSGRAKLIWQLTPNGSLTGLNQYGPGIINGIRNALGSNVDILILPVIFYGHSEDWNSGGWATGGDPGHSGYATFAATYGCYYYDWTGVNITDPNTFLNAEATYNTGHATEQFFSWDGTHTSFYLDYPMNSAAPFTGQQLAANILNAAVLDIIY